MVTHCLIYIFTNMLKSKYNQPEVLFNVTRCVCERCQMMDTNKECYAIRACINFRKKIDMNIENSSPSLMDFGEIA